MTNIEMTNIEKYRNYLDSKLKELGKKKSIAFNEQHIEEYRSLSTVINSLINDSVYFDKLFPSDYQKALNHLADD